MSPYLKNHRLQDIVGALQIMGSAKNYKRSAEKWAKKIENNPLSANSWNDIFREHPEFFREGDDSKVCLMWRKGLPWNTETDERLPLDATQITALMETAIQFHSKALEVEKDKRWWIPVAAIVMSFVGAMLGALVS